MLSNPEKAKGVTSVIKSLLAVTVVLAVLHIVLYICTLLWMWQVSLLKDCDCAKDWRREYILIFSPAVFLHLKNPKRKLIVPIPRLPFGAVFPPLPLLTLPDVFHAILDAPPSRTHTTAFHFDWTPAAAAHNLAVLRRYKGDLRVALASQPFSTISPGSEFRPAHLLAPLLSCHPLWSAFANRITDGAEFPLRDIPDAERLADVAASLARGNHKSARGHEAKQAARNA